MVTDPHDDLIAGQFGPRARAYLASAVHAQGDDLGQLRAGVAARADARELQALDMGCGGGHVTFTLAPLVSSVTAFDLSDQMLAVVASEAARRGLANVRTVHGNAEQLPFPDASFDVVVSRYSAHHWRRLGPCLAEARRVLKPGGAAVFMDVVSPGVALLDVWLQSLELLRDVSHVRDYTVEEWRQAAGGAGFAVGPVVERRLRLEFGSWVERIGTPEALVQAIHMLQARAPADVAAYFAMEADGSFTVDTMVLEAALYD